MSVVVLIVLFLVLTVFVLVVPCLFLVFVSNLKEKNMSVVVPIVLVLVLTVFVLVVLVGGVLVVLLCLGCPMFFLVLVGNPKEKKCVFGCPDCPSPCSSPVFVLFLVLTVFVLVVIVSGVLAVFLVLVVLCFFLSLLVIKKKKYVCSCPDCPNPCLISCLDCFCLGCPR